MYGVKLCLGLNEAFGLPFEKQIQAFRQIGFEGFFSEWQRGRDIPALRRVADSEGMIFQSIHAPFGRIDRIWEPAEDTSDVISEQIECLRACADSGVPIMVSHAFIGFIPPFPIAGNTFGQFFPKS